MLPRRCAWGFAGLALLVSVTLICSQPTEKDDGIFDQTKVEENAPEKSEEGIDPQARGPVHEAFASPSSSSAPQPQPIAPNAPPAAIEEMPPEQKPDGDNVQWLNGYWHYDEEAKDFLWVSGLWRQIPPGMDWVPGAWNPVTGGYQWSSGFWKNAVQSDLVVVPTPPEPLNAVDAPAPNADSTYVPGCWVYRETRYVWRPAYWMPCRIGWVWVPARYVWSPCGYYFVDGYYDYLPRERGLLFCPIIVRRDYLRPGFIYRPRYVIHDQALLSCLFVHSGHGCYHFGDYYDAAYARRGYVAWSQYRVNRRYHDALYDHFRFVHRANPAWERNLQTLTQMRIQNQIPRPPVTLVQQNKLVVNKQITINQTRDVVLLAPLAKVNRTVVPLVKLDAVKLQEQQTFAKKLNEASVKRTTIETNIIKTKAIPKIGDPVKAVALTVPTNTALPRPERLQTLPPPPMGQKAQVDPKVIIGTKIDPKEKEKFPPIKEKEKFPPMKEKEKEKTPPMKEKEKEKTPPMKEKEKEKTPPMKEKEKTPPEKEKPKPPPEKEKPKPLPEKEKEKPKPPPEKEKKILLPPKEKLEGQKEASLQETLPPRRDAFWMAHVERDRMKPPMIFVRKLG